MHPLPTAPCRGAKGLAGPTPPRCMPEPAQSATGTVVLLRCSALLCQQDLRAVGESHSPRTHHRHKPDTGSSSRAPDTQGNTSLGTRLWMLPLLQPRWSIPTAQDRRTPSLASTLASQPPSLPRSPGCRRAPAARTSLVRIQQRTHGAPTYIASMQGGLAPGCLAAGLERQLLSAPGSGADPLLDLVSLGI